jgi:hypothetical protein
MGQLLLLQLLLGLRYVVQIEVADLSRGTLALAPGSATGGGLPFSEDGIPSGQEFLQLKGGPASAQPRPQLKGRSSS